MSVGQDPLIAHDAALRAEADALLSETGLMDLVREHGSVHVDSLRRSLANPYCKNRVRFDMVTHGRL